MVRLNRIYTRTGDDGTTGLIGGERVGKDDPRIEAYGTVDELNAAAGVWLAELGGDERLAALRAKVIGIQHALFDLGAALAVRPGSLDRALPSVDDGDVAWLEADLDAMNADLAELRSFVLPGGSRAVAHSHVVRTVCRRAERRVQALARAEAVDPAIGRYLNRLSDWLFVAGRWAAQRCGEAEALWTPGARAETGRGR